MLIYVQVINQVVMLVVLPIAIATTSVLMFLLVAVIDEVSYPLINRFCIR
ncbi:unnamed protein product [Protopolystoma xenopodis]|uniref:Uncharacterized protein n=1 Tax=Protopolystoma xenopodis TaxID=117903 RepID=A0A448WBL0_9PLAT|nr:unnamed protein product [Protopolystoma xenopodis]